jgi:hypothetical protein
LDAIQQVRLASMRIKQAADFREHGRIVAGLFYEPGFRRYG